MEKIIKRYTRRYPGAILKGIAQLPILNADDFINFDRMIAWTAQLQKILDTGISLTQQWSTNLVQQEESGHWLPQVVIGQHGTEQNFMLPFDFYATKDYKDMSSISAQLTQMVDEGARVQRGEKTHIVIDFEQALAWLMEEAKRGQTIQRYKGLGEMNPSQLWETTMDPEVRRMLQVTVEDAVAADEIFTTLMGDHVEPRREFIETNALNAGNIDI